MELPNELEDTPTEDPVGLEGATEEALELSLDMGCEREEAVATL